MTVLLIAFHALSYFHQNGGGGGGGVGEVLHPFYAVSCSILLPFVKVLACLRILNR